MKPISRMLLIGSALVAAVGLLAVLTFDKYLAILLWPGFLLMNYVYSLLGFDGIAFEHFGWIFWPALLQRGALRTAVSLVSRGCGIETEEGFVQAQSLGY